MDNTSQEPTHKERFFKGDEFYSENGSRMRYRKWENDQETISLNNNFFAHIKSHNRSSFTIQITGIKKRMEETVEFHKLNFR